MYEPFKTPYGFDGYITTRRYDKEYENVTLWAGNFYESDAFSKIVEFYQQHNIPVHCNTVTEYFDGSDCHCESDIAVIPDLKLVIKCETGAKTHFTCYADELPKKYVKAFRTGHNPQEQDFVNFAHPCRRID